MKIIFFGSTGYVLPILELLFNKYDLALIITTENNDTDPVRYFAKKNSIQVAAIDSLQQKGIQKSIQSVNPDVAILASFGLLIPKIVLDMFPKGIINLHPSLLPKYRGPTPVQTALLNGDNTTGISIIKLDNELDHGPVLGFEKLPISLDDTNVTLHNSLFSIGASLLQDLLPQYMSGTLVPNEQQHNLATYTNRLERKDGYINMTNPPSKEIINRMIRAFTPWPGVWTKLSIKGKLKIVKLLPENKIQVEGKKQMSFREFLNGYPTESEKLKQII